MSWHVKKPTKLYTEPRADSETVRDPREPAKPLHVLFVFEIQILQHAGGWRQIRARSGEIDETGWVGANQLFEDAEPDDEPIDVEVFLRSLRKKAHDAGFDFTLGAYIGAVAWLRTRVRNVIEDRAQGPIGPFGFSVTRWNELIKKYDDLNLIPEDIVDWPDQAEVATAWSAEYVTELTELFERQSRQGGEELQRPNSADLYVADLLGLDAAKAILKDGPSRTVNKPLEDVYEGENDTKAFVEELLRQHGDAFMSNGEPKTIAQTLADLRASFDEAYTALGPHIDTIRGELRSLNAGSHLTTLGKLSRKYETGGAGPGMVSKGIDDPGGISYGSYQMTSREDGGTVKKFVTAGDFKWADRFVGKEPGTPAFGDEWKRLAEEQPEAFFATQHAYIKKTHFDPFVQSLEAELDLGQASGALRDVAWSTAVQHGTGNGPRVFRNAIQNAGGATPGDRDSERRLIKEIYAERARRDAKGLVHFSKVKTEKVRKSLENRFAAELNDALKMLDEA